MHRVSVILPLLMLVPGAGAEFTLHPQEGGRTLLQEDGRPVLVYNQGDQLAEGAAPDRTRSCYVHPLYGPHGEILTDDFPADHLHHRGVSMMWPRMKVGDRPVDHWHIDGIRTLNERVAMEHEDGNAILVAENAWTLDDGTVVARETTRWAVHPSTDWGRTIDVSATITAGAEPITLQGAAPPKGYGGHLIRFGPRTGEVITTDQGVIDGDRDRLPFRWADYSATFKGAHAASGITMIPDPAGEDYPPSWQLRHYGILGMSWPGLGQYVIEPGESITRSYRLWIHRGPAAGSACTAWSNWMREQGRSTPTAHRMMLLGEDFEPTSWSRVGTASYKIADGTLRGWGQEPRNSFFAGPTLADFELELEFKPEPGSNSGIQVRSMVTEDGLAVRGYQVEIDTTDRAWTGGLYDELRRGWLEPLDDDPVARSALMPDRWNHMRIIMEGPHVRTWVNGIPCVDAYDATDLEGILAFQVHGGSCDMQWRNVALTHLGRHAWRPLLDGTTMKGWTPSGGGTWTIEDGILVGRQQADDPEHGHLIHEQTLDDFTLRFEFMSPRGNSGAYFRVDRGGRAGVLGFQAEIDGRSGKTGGLYETGGRQWMVPSQDETEAFVDAYRPEQWNTMTITADGPRIVVHVNGTKTADIVDEQGRRSGLLALQLHGNEDMEVRFRSIELLVPEAGTMFADGRPASPDG